MSQSDRGSRPFDHIVGYINTFSCFLSNIMYFQIFSLLVLPNLYYLKPTAAPKSATENHHFWEASIASHEKWLPLSWAKQRKFPSLHTPYWCTQKCHRKPPWLFVQSAQTAQHLLRRRGNQKCAMSLITVIINDKCKGSCALRASFHRSD